MKCKIPQKKKKGKKFGRKKRISSASMTNQDVLHLCFDEKERKINGKTEEIGRDEEQGNKQKVTQK